MSSTRFAVVGLGRIGARHAQTINALDGVELAAVCDPDPSMLARAAEFAPAAKPFQDFKAMLDSRSVDMVVLAVPSQMHCAMTLDALNADIGRASRNDSALPNTEAIVTQKRRLAAILNAPHVWGA